MNDTLLNLERQIGLGATFAARLLGVAYPTYAHYRSRRRELPLYHQRHIEVLLALPPAKLKALIERYAHGREDSIKGE